MAGDGIVVGYMCGSGILAIPEGVIPVDVCFMIAQGIEVSARFKFGVWSGVWGLGWNLGSEWDWYWPWYVPRWLPGRVWHSWA